MATATSFWRLVLGAPFRGRTWARLLYLGLAFPLGLAYAICLTIGFALGLGLALLLIGLPLIAATFALALAAAELERGLARTLLGAVIPRPPATPRGTGFWERVQRTVTDPRTWKSLAFLITKLPIGIAGLAVVCLLLFPAAVLFAAPVISTNTPIVFIAWEIDGSAEGLLAIPVAVGLVVAAAHAANGLGVLLTRYSTIMLGPRKADLLRQVDLERESRARIIAAGDEERRRIERDLHDGAQQRIVALGLTLGMVEKAIERGDDDRVRELVGTAREEASAAVRELRSLAQGIHPTILTERGLGPALEQVAGRAPVPISVENVPRMRLPDQVEATVYFVVSEALTNMAKHAKAESGAIRFAHDGRRLMVEVSDDGCGGASAGGSGLRGLADRVTALDGHMALDSPAGAGTRILVSLPLLPGGSPR